MTSAFQRIDASLGGIGAGAAVAANAAAVANSTVSSANGFSFEPGEIAAIRQGWLDLSEDYRESVTRADDIRLQPPGNEEASKDNVRAGLESWRMHIESLMEKREYCLSQAQKFHDALNAYEGNEHSAVTSLLGSSSEGGI
ncbi:hypothetical protein ACOBQX_16140 [Actinokineospora sp. G85]|uniref:hypothetical protein n=1 Tax=Actinokineospora sp. G85 TaxID=3406626 RepID=UPI003C72888E